MKKIILSLGALTAVLVGASMFAAFEAHVVNVTAKIENALLVPIDPVKFGTVFPQEQINATIPISLSTSFLAEDQTRVDTVSYMIRQKPKCAVTSAGGTVVDPQFPTATGEVIVEATGGYHIDCGPAPVGMPTDETWGVLPSLCPYLSKHSSNEGDKDVPAFHQPFTIVNGQVVWTEATGTLSKPNQTTANWTIDLKVPCFGGYCAQDWATFVHGINPNADPALYTQDINNEHKVFGCDLWFETTGVTLD